MKDTVAIALITSLSTLSAAAITGSVAAWTSQNQTAGQRGVAREERTEQRVVRRSQLRRDAYVVFLNKCDQAYRRLDHRWMDTLDPQAPGHDDAYPALRALDEAYNVVLLEGPGEVADEGGFVIRSINREYRRQRQLVDVSAGGRSLAEQHHAEHLAAVKERTLRRDAFVAAARRAVE